MDVTLEEFTSCPHNLAFNRQTRMLADLDLVNCYENLSNFHNVSSDIERYKFLKMLVVQFSKRGNDSMKIVPTHFNMILISRDPSRIPPKLLDDL